MNAVVYFSCTGNSKKIAQAIAAKTGFEPLELTRRTYDGILSGAYGTAAIVFPVHCQSYPKFLKRFFKNLNAVNVALIATYGKAHAGNAVYEAAKLISGEIIAAAYIPAGHSYLYAEADGENVPEALTEKILSPSPVVVPKRKKTPFAGFLPSVRSRLTVKIYKTKTCINCNACGEACPCGAITFGKVNSKCVRCLKCVKACPHGALKFEKSRILSRYLKKTHFEETILII